MPAGAAVIAWAAWKGRKGPSSAKAWGAVALFALVDGALFQGFLAEGLQRVPAGIGSVLIDSQPLTVAVVAALLFGESLSVWGVLGLVLGIGGLFLLEVPQETLISWSHLDFGAQYHACTDGLSACAQWSACNVWCGFCLFLFDCKNVGFSVFQIAMTQ
jgi:drug/metabolite transporter (DMT)-like permease